MDSWTTYYAKSISLTEQELCSKKETITRRLLKSNEKPCITIMSLVKSITPSDYQNYSYALSVSYITSQVRSIDDLYLCREGHVNLRSTDVLQLLIPTYVLL